MFLPGQKKKKAPSAAKGKTPGMKVKRAITVKKVACAPRGVYCVYMV